MFQRIISEPLFKKKKKKNSILVLYLLQPYTVFLSLRLFLDLILNCVFRALRVTLIRVREIDYENIYYIHKREGAAPD